LGRAYAYIARVIKERNRGEKPDKWPQGDKFRDLACELECDEDEERFEETVKRIAKPSPSPPKED
jgi:hypothetical protein